MKFSYALLLAFVISFGSDAQNLVYPDGQHQSHLVADDQVEVYNLKVTTPQPEPVQFAWELISNSFPLQWSYSLCDYGGCYVGIPDNGTMTAITKEDAMGGVKGFFKMNVTVGKDYGDGLVKIYVYDKANYERGDTISWRVVNSPVGLEVNGELQSINVYPNPASNFANVDCEGQHSIEVYNGSGQLVNQLTGSNKTVLDLTQYQKGFYLLKVSNEQGIETKRLVVQ